MKQVVMSILLFTITSCAVESAPVSTSTTTDDQSSQADRGANLDPHAIVSTPIDDESAQADRDANLDPHAIVCEPPGLCETLAQCSHSGGHVVGPCTSGQGLCCHL